MWNESMRMLKKIHRTWNDNFVLVQKEMKSVHTKRSPHHALNISKIVHVFQHYCIKIFAL